MDKQAKHRAELEARYRKPIKFSILTPENKARVVEQLIDRLGLEVIEEATPDYATYELREKH